MVGVPASLRPISVRVVPRVLHYVDTLDVDSVAHLPGTLVVLAVDAGREYPVVAVERPRQRVIVSLAVSGLGPAAALRALDHYDATWLDVRVARDDVLDPDRVRRVANTLAALRRERPHCRLQLTMVAMPYGLGSAGTNLVLMTWPAGLDVVNVLVGGSFGDGFRRPPGDYAIEAMASVRRQLLKIDQYKDSRPVAVGITLEGGADGFPPREAAKVATYAARHAEWVPFVGSTGEATCLTVHEALYAPKKNVTWQQER